MTYSLLIFRSTLLKKQYEKPIDTTEDLVRSGKKVFIRAGTSVPSLLAASDDKWLQLVSKSHIPYSKEESYNISLRLYKDPDIASLSVYVYVLDKQKRDPRYKGLQGLRPTKEVVLFKFVTWSVQRNSKWLDHLNKHILLLHQVQCGH